MTSRQHMYYINDIFLLKNQQILNIDVSSINKVNLSKQFYKYCVSVIHEDNRISNQLLKEFKKILKGDLQGVNVCTSRVYA